MFDELILYVDAMTENTTQNSHFHLSPFVYQMIKNYADMYNTSIDNVLGIQANENTNL